MLQESNLNSCFSSTPLSCAMSYLFLIATGWGGALSCHYYPCHIEKDTLWEWRNLLKINISASCGTGSQIHTLWLHVLSWQKPRSCRAGWRNEFCFGIGLLTTGRRRWVQHWVCCKREWSISEHMWGSQMASYYQRQPNLATFYLIPPCSAFGSLQSLLRLLNSTKAKFLSISANSNMGINFLLPPRLKMSSDLLCARSLNGGWRRNVDCY